MAFVSALVRKEKRYARMLAEARKDHLMRQEWDCF